MTHRLRTKAPEMPVNGLGEVQQYKLMKLMWILHFVSYLSFPNIQPTAVSK